MRYFELIEKKSTQQAATKSAPGAGAKTELIRIPAGAGPVQLYIRNGKVFVISDKPLDRVILP